MSKTLSYRGQLLDGVQQKISLSTPKGKRGYKITKFQTLSPQPGVDSSELVCKVYSKDQTNQISGTVNFDEGDLLGVSFYGSSATSQSGTIETIIFDNEVFNQDVFIYAVDNKGGTISTNFYLELETMELSDTQSTQLTLKNLRTIASR